jgi:signal transduction histidine kinase
VTRTLARAKVALEKAFDAMPDLVAILDDEGRIQRLNKALSERVQRPLRELLGLELQALFPCCREWLAQSMREPPSDQQSWTEIVDERTDVAYEVSLLRLDVPPPLLGTRVVFMRDVSRERELARQLIAFERRAASGDLLAGVAHEVRNPLAAIQAAAQFLKNELAGEQALAPPLDIIARQVERLRVLMEDLLHLGRPFEHLAVASESLRDVVARAVDAWRHNVKNRGHEVKVDAPEPGPLHARVDAGRIEQVIVNLLDNAAQHSPKGGAIAVSLARADGFVRLRVTDQGAGIPAGALPHVFEPFFTTREGGTGLGLSVVKGIVDGHGGAISVWNNEPGPGASVEVRLPASELHSP